MPGAWRLVNAPFVKVEATKFTEVGYVGRDVEAMIRDLVETAIRIVQAERMLEVEDKALQAANEGWWSCWRPCPVKTPLYQPLGFLFQAPAEIEDQAAEDAGFQERLRQAREEQQEIRRRLENGYLEERQVEIEVEDRRPPMLEFISGQGIEEMGVNLQDILGNIIPPRKRKEKFL